MCSLYHPSSYSRHVLPKLSSYVHSGKIGVLVDYAGADEVGKDLAMHIAATKPRAVDEHGVSEADKEAERSVARLKAAESGKPAEIVEKMVEGSVQKFLKEVALTSQPFDLVSLSCSYQIASPRISGCC